MSTKQALSSNYQPKSKKIPVSTRGAFTRASARRASARRASARIASARVNTQLNNNSEYATNNNSSEPLTYVFTLCEIPKIIDIPEIKKLVTEYLQPRIEYYKYKNRAPFIEDEFSEYFIAKITGGIEIGDGSTGMDVKTSDNNGIDVMCIVMTGATSNEKSLMQNFHKYGNDLDRLFLERKADEAVELFSKGYYEKLVKYKDLTKLYILGFISTKTEVWLVCFEINIDNIRNVKSGGFVGLLEAKNIIVIGFIDPAYGNVELYKSKKRLELRLHKTVLESIYAVKLYTIPE